MTTFRGGPLGQFTLLLKRAPEYVRAAADGVKRDALDMPGDEPGPTETLYAYRRAGLPSDVHLRLQKGSGYYKVVEYEYVADQPDQDTMRDTETWRGWCWAQRERDAAPGQPDRGSE